MLDELRQMDHLTRDQRRKVKLVQVARERWRSSHEGEARASDLSQLCGLSVDEIFQLEALAQHGQSLSEQDNADEDTPLRRSEPATEQDEVEARVDTAILMRRLKVFFDALPERDRQVIDAYLGVGLTPGQLAQNLNVTPSRLSQMFKSLCQRIGVNLGTTPPPVPAQRASDRVRGLRGKALDDLVTERDLQADAPPDSGAAWGRRLQGVLVQPPGGDNAERIIVDSSTRWG
jgi:RNA polymerase sigma factor for flagellar operon FliA